MPINYNSELLYNLCNEKGIQLKKDYNNIKLYCNTKIEFICPTCGIDVSKYFTYLYQLIFFFYRYLKNLAIIYIFFLINIPFNLT